MPSFTTHQKNNGTVLYGILTKPQGTETWYWVKYKEWSTSDDEYWQEPPNRYGDGGIKNPEMEYRVQHGAYYIITQQPYTGKFIKNFGYNFVYNPLEDFKDVLDNARSTKRLYVPHHTPFIKRNIERFGSYIFSRPYEVKSVVNTRINKELKISEERVEFVKKLYLLFIRISLKDTIKYEHNMRKLMEVIPTDLIEEYKTVFNTKYSFTHWGDRAMQLMRYLQQLEYINIVSTDAGFEIDLFPGIKHIIGTPEGIQVMSAQFT